MDPFSLTTGVVGLAGAAMSTTVFLIQLVGSLRDAPEVVDELVENLQVLKTALDLLGDIDKEALAADQGEHGPNKTTRLAVQGCDRVLERISKDLSPLHEKMQQGKAQVVWAVVKTAVNESSIKDNIARLDSAKMNLVIAMAVDERYARAIAGYASSPSNLYRRDSVSERGFVRGKSAKSKVQQPGQVEGKGDDDLYQPPPPYSARSREDNFPRLLDDTLARMEQMISANGEIMADEKDENSGEAFRTLWRADTGKMQAVWGPNMQTIEKLKSIISNRSCEAFLRILKAEVRTGNNIADAAPLTLNWIWTDSTYLDWVNPAKPQTLFLIGKPGSGKSVFTKTVVERLSAEAGNGTSDSMVVLSYFCNSRERPEESCLNILRAFIFQYLWAAKSEFARVAQQCQSLALWDPVNPGDFRFSFDILWDVFSTILDTSPKLQICCVIDAIDECTQDGTTAEFITRIIARPQKPRGAAGAMKLFISSRPDWEAENYICPSSTPPLKIRLEPELMRDDIAQIVDAWFQQFEEKLAIEKNEITELKDKLVAKADGMILWAILALREIEKKIAITVGWLRKVIEKLPSGLSEIYDRILQKLFKRYGGGGDDDEELLPATDNSSDDDCSETDIVLVWKAIQWVARAGRPLTLEELKFALALDAGDTSFEDSRLKRISNIEDFVRRISLLEIVPPDPVHDGIFPSGASSDHDASQASDGQIGLFPSQPMTPCATVRLIHQSAKDYILGGGVVRPWNGKGRREGQGLPNFDDSDIARLLVTVLKFSEFEGGPRREFSGDTPFSTAFRNHVESFGFLEYAVAFWTHHLRRVSEPEESLLSLVGSFGSDSPNHVRFYLQVYNFIFLGTPDIVDDFSGLHIMAAEGLDSMVKFYVDRGEELDARDQAGRTPYMMAVHAGFRGTAQILANAGACTSDVESDPWRIPKLTELQALSYEGRSQRVAELLGEGHDAHATDAYGRTTLFYAGQGGNLPTVAALLDVGADPLVRDQRGRIPLDVTLEPECRDLVANRMKERYSEMGASPPPPLPQGSSCVHYPHCFPRQSCDRCGRFIFNFFYHCCDCSGDSTESYDICSLCWDGGKRCRGGSSHEMLCRVMLEQLESWLEYSPDLAHTEIREPFAGPAMDGHEAMNNREEADDRGPPTNEKRGGGGRTGGGFRGALRAFWQALRLGLCATGAEKAC